MEMDIDNHSAKIERVGCVQRSGPAIRKLEQARADALRVFDAATAVAFIKVVRKIKK